MKIKFVLFEITLEMIKELYLEFLHFDLRSWDITIRLICK